MPAGKSPAAMVPCSTSPAEPTSRTWTTFWPPPDAQARLPSGENTTPKKTDSPFAPSYGTRPVRASEPTEKRSTDSNCAAVPLELTRTLSPSGERVRPQGPARPGPTRTDVCSPAGVSCQPAGDVGAAVAPAAVASVI